MVERLVEPVKVTEAASKISYIPDYDVYMSVHISLEDDEWIY